MYNEFRGGYKVKRLLLVLCLFLTACGHTYTDEDYLALQEKYDNLQIKYQDVSESFKAANAENVKNKYIIEEYEALEGMFGTISHDLIEFDVLDVNEAIDQNIVGTYKENNNLYYIFYPSGHYLHLGYVDEAPSTYLCEYSTENGFLWTAVPGTGDSNTIGYYTVLSNGNIEIYHEQSNTKNILYRLR